MEPKSITPIRTGIAVLVSALAVGVTSAQIPEQAKWEITFQQVEAAANLASLRDAAPDSVEARLMERPWSATGPLSFLRVARSDGTVQATGLLYWRRLADGVSYGQPAGPDVVCRDGICVLPIDLSGQRDWVEMIDKLSVQNACPPRNPDVLSVCFDCEEVWIKTSVNGVYREQSCQEPAANTLARDLLDLMKASADAARHSR